MDVLPRVTNFPMNKAERDGEVGRGLISGVLMCNAYSIANINDDNHTQISLFQLLYT